MATFDEDEDVSFNIKKKLDVELEEEEKKTQPKVECISPVEGGHMKVYLRVRPLSNTEKHDGEDQQCIKFESDKMLVTNAPKDSNTFKNAGRSTKCVNQKFTFSKIFNEDTTQKKFFDEAVLGTVKQFIKGQNCLQFTYGVTNSGKTYTIQGYQNDLGILPRALDVLFSTIRDRQWQGKMLKPTRFCDVMSLSVNQQEDDLKLKKSLLKMADVEEPDACDMTINMSRLTADSTMSEDSLMMRQSIASSTSSHSLRDSGELDPELVSSICLPTDDNVLDIENLSQFKCSVWVSFAEIYNENIHDLLEPLSVKKKTVRSRPMLQLREDKNGTPYVRGLKEVHCTNADEAYKLLTLGKKNLQIACTKLNRNSSRSHCIFTIKLIQVVDTDNPNAARTSMLSFCDLAGSERYTKTGSFGDRIKEAGNINTSLLTLGRCIQILRHNQTNKDHPQVVPFRESKLTRMFQSFFCGKGRASMIVNINPCASTFDETLHALKYSAIAKQIIVVQEPEKPKVVHSARQFSMLLSQTSRQTIGWGTPGTYAKVYQEESLLETGEEDEEEDEETASETEREKELMELLQQMKLRLIEEKKKTLVMEVRIRDEVCQEMAQQLVEIEHHYSERLKREQVLQEEKAERRMDILTQSVLKSRKRQRIFDDDTEKPEKDSVEHQDVLMSLKTEVRTLREASSISGQERDKLQQENTTIKFRLQDLETQLEELMAAKDEDSMSQDAVTEMGELISKLSDAEAEIEKQTASVTKLQQVIDILQCNAAEADDKLDARRSEHDKSNKRVATLEKELAESDRHVKSFQRQLEERDDKVAEMQSQSQQQEDQLQLLQASLDQISSELEKLQADNDQQEEIMAGLRQEIAERNDEYDRLQCSLSLKDGADTELKQALAVKTSALEDLQETLHSTENKLKSAKEAAELQSELDKSEMEKELAEMRESVSNYERQVDEAQQLVLQREEELDSIKTNLEGKGGLEQELVQLNEDLRQAKSQYSAAEKDLQVAHDLQHQYEQTDAEKDEQLEALQQELNAALDQVKSLQSSEESLKSELEELEKKSSEMVLSHESMENELFEAQECQQDVKEKLAQSKAAVEELEEAAEKAKTSNLGVVTELETKLADVNSLVNDKSEVISNLTEELENLKDINSENEALKESVAALNSEVSVFETLREQTKRGEENVNKLQSEVDNLQTKLQAERKQVEEHNAKIAEQLEELAEVKDLLASAEQKVETSAQEQLDSKQQQEGSNDLVDKLQNELKQQQDLLDSEKGHFEKQIAELQDQIKSLEKNLEDAEMDQKDRESRIEDLNRKLSGLQMTVDMNEEEHETERRIHEDEMSKTRAELQAKANQLMQVESELEHARSMASGQEKDKTETQAEIEELKRNVQTLEQKLDDAEYNHQISCRQLRREKGNAEKMLKSTEEANTELEQKIQELQEQTMQAKERKDTEQKELNEALNTQKERVNKLEEVIKDLESCLKSSKEHEGKAIQESENFKLRCRRLETDCNQKEDTICSLNDEIERFREESVMAANNSNAEMTEQMESLRNEVMDLQKSVDDLEFELSDIREEKILGEREADNNLTEAKREIERTTELSDQLKESLEALEKRSTEVQDHVQYLEDLVEAKQDQITQLEEQTNEHDSLVSELEAKLRKVEKDLTEIKAQTSSESKDLQSQLIEKTNELAQCKSDMETKESKLEEFSEAKVDLEIERDVLTSKLKEHQELVKSKTSTEEDLNVKCTELKESRDLVNKHVQQLTEMEDKCVNLSDELETLKEQKATLEEQLSAKDEEVLVCNNKISELVKLEEKCVSLEGQVGELKDSKDDLVKDVATKERHLSGMTDLEKRLEKMQNANDERLRQIEELNQEIEAEREVGMTLKEKVSELEAKLHEQSPKVEECGLLQSQVKTLQQQAVSMQSSATEVTSLSCKLTDLQTELEVLNIQKDKSDRLVRTLQEEVDELEDKMKEKTKKSSNTVAGLEQEMEKLQATMKKNLADTESAAQSELEALQREVREKADSVMTLEARCKKLKEEMDNKDQRLKSRNESLTNFMTKMDAEKNSYEIALKDAHSNEMLIETLKKAMEEQESVMQQQDRVLENKEDDLKNMMDDIDTHLTRIQQLQNSEKQLEESGRSHKKEKEAAERRIQCLELEKEMAETHAKELKKRLGSERSEDLGNLQRSKERVEERLAVTKARLEEAEKQLRERTSQDNDLRQTTRELQEAERQLKVRDEELSTLRKNLRTLEAQEAERKSLRREESDSSVRDSHALQMLKTKFQAKEDLVHQLEQEKVQWKARAENIEDQKAQELNKWREERDKLVDKIQQILQEKDAEIKSLQNGDESQLVTELRRQLEEKDVLVCQMTTEQDKAASTRRRGRSSRHTGSSSSDDDVTGLKRELDSLHKQMEQVRHDHKHEINKILRAKDSIIDDMRNQNHKLTSHLSGEELGLGHHLPTAASTPGPISHRIPSDEMGDDASKARSRRGRPKKRGENEMVGDLSMSVSTTKRGRKVSRSAKASKSMLNDENEDPSLIIISEDIIDLDESTRKPALNNSTNILDQTGDVFQSPKMTTAHTTTQKRKKRLKKTVEEPFMESPTEISAAPLTEETPAHDIVKRKLRSRRK